MNTENKEKDVIHQIITYIKYVQKQYLWRVETL